MKKQTIPIMFAALTLAVLPTVTSAATISSNSRTHFSTDMATPPASKLLTCASLQDSNNGLKPEEYAALERACIEQSMGTINRTPGAETSTSTSMVTTTRSPRANRSGTSPTGMGPGKGGIEGRIGTGRSLQESEAEAANSGTSGINEGNWY